MEKRIRGAHLLALLAASVAAPPAFAGDLDSDTESRHARAASSSSGSSSSSSDDDDDDDDDTVSFGSDSYADASYYSDTGDTTPSRPVPGELVVFGGALLDRLSGAAGGEVVHQDGAGFIAAAELTLLDRDDPVDDRSGFAFFASYGRAWLLQDFRPAGASFSSDLALDLLEVDAGPQYLERRGRLDIRYGIGFGVTWLRSDEEFSDGLTLQETLAVGLRFRPYVSLTPATDGSRPFVDFGLIGFLGHITKYEADYDSLIDGLDPIMLTPYARVGYLFQANDAASIGVAYELGVVGSVWTTPSFTHRAHLVLRFKTY